MNPAWFRIAIVLLCLAIVFAMPSLLLYFLGYLPIHDFNRDSHSTSCFLESVSSAQTTCHRSCNCYTLCHPSGKTIVCSTTCSSCPYTCYYVSELFDVKKVDGSMFGYTKAYNDAFYDNQVAAQQTLLDAQKYVNSTFLCYYDDKKMPTVVQFTLYSDFGFYVAAIVVGGVGALLFLIYLALELYWRHIYRERDDETGTEMK